MLRRMIDLARSLTGKAVEVASALVFELTQLVAMAITFPIVTRSFGPETYGEYTTVYVFAGFAATWVSLAGGAAIAQLLIQHDRSTRSVLSTGRRQVWWSAVPIAVAGTGASVALFGTDIILPAVLIFGSDLLLGGLANVHLSTVYAVRGILASSRLHMILPALKAVGVLGLVAIDRVTLLGVVGVNTAATVVLWLATVISVRRMDMHDGPETSRSEMLRYTGTYAATISANATQDQGEKIVLASFRPAAEVGEYQAAYRLVELALIPLRALDAAATRWVLQPDGRQNIHVIRAKRLSKPIFAYGVVCMVLLVVCRPLVRFVIGDEFDLAIEMVAWLSGFPLVRALADVPVLGLIGLDRNKERMLLGLSGAAFALICYLILVPTLGWRGAVIGTYLSEFFTLAGGWILLLRLQRVDSDERALRDSDSEAEAESDTGDGARDGGDDGDGSDSGGSAGAADTGWAPPTGPPARDALRPPASWEPPTHSDPARWSPPPVDDSPRSTHR